MSFSYLLPCYLFTYFHFVLLGHCHYYLCFSESVHLEKNNCVYVGGGGGAWIRRQVKTHSWSLVWVDSLMPYWKIIMKQSDWVWKCKTNEWLWVKVIITITRFPCSAKYVWQDKEWPKTLWGLFTRFYSENVILHSFFIL